MKSKIGNTFWGFSWLVRSFVCFIVMVFGFFFLWFGCSFYGRILFNLGLFLGMYSVVRCYIHNFKQLRKYNAYDKQDEDVNE